MINILFKILSLLIISFASWTVSCHIAVLCKLNLLNLSIIFPFVLFVSLLFFALIKNNEHLIDLLYYVDYINRNSIGYIKLSIVGLLTISILYSWSLFLILSVICLIYEIFIKKTCYPRIIKHQQINNSNNKYWYLIIITALVYILLAMYISRSDLDDAYYASVASFTSTHPLLPIMSTDTMFGETGLPIIFPSYKFSSFELLPAFISYVFQTSPLLGYYVYLIPIWIIFVICATYLLANELTPQKWIMNGTIAIVLTILLGECHRGYANFSFVRIFQGKAVFVSALVPAIYYLIYKYIRRGNNIELYLLTCSMICAIGLSNFGMLAGPMAFISAMLANYKYLYECKKKFIYVTFNLLIPLPYLLYVLKSSSNSLLVSITHNELPMHVWTTVFGEHQQFVFIFFIALGLICTPNHLTKMRIGIPILILLGIYLNPLFAPLISRYVTTPEVYWRVVWSVPMMIFLSSSIVLVVSAFENRGFKPLISAILILAFGLIIMYVAPYTTIRKNNIDGYNQYGHYKVRENSLSIANAAVRAVRNDGRILAPEDISGVISEFELHPKLIIVRRLYLDLLSRYLPDDSYNNRLSLLPLLTCDVNQHAIDNLNISKSLKALDVEVIVTPPCDHKVNDEIITNFGYIRYTTKYGYSVWSRK